MRIARVTKIIVALLVLTFVGQAAASVSASCMDNMPECPQQMQDNSQCMDMDASESSEPCADCACSLGSCSTALISTLQSIDEPTSTSSLSHYAGLIENQLISSLYRPPIFR